MSQKAVCPRCGFANPVGQSFCSRCAARLTSLSRPSSVPAGNAVSVTQSTALEPPSTDYVLWRGIDRTEIGLLVLIVGIILGAIPYTYGVGGGTLSILGVLLLVLGRDVFGRRHSRFVLTGLVIFFVGIAAGTLNATELTISLSSSEASYRFLLGSIIVQIVYGMAILLFTYSLQSRNGKILLWAGYIASVPAVIVSPPDLNLLFAFRAQAQLISYLSLGPALITAVAFYLVWSRIRRRELPKDQPT